MSTASDGQQSSDTYAKTLALLRRLLVGNGYALEDIKIEKVEEKDLHLPGRIALELQVVPIETKVPGLPKGNENAVFKTREEIMGYIGGFNAELAEDSSWVDEIRERLAKNPTGGWGIEQGDWELGKQTKRATLVLPCDICRGEKQENCRLCFGQREMNCPQCNGSSQMNCPACHGSGANPSDRNSPCPQCRGQARIACRNCQARGRVMCTQCRGTGRTNCSECLGIGFFCEETVLKVSAQGSFQLGSLASTPKGVTQALDTLSVTDLARGHAVITPAPSMAGPPAIEFDALLPYGRYNLKIKDDVHDVIAVGMKPILSEFPPLLDDTLKHVPDELNASTLVPLARKYRLIRELTEAMGRGEKPGRFFAQRYPFGLTAPVAFGIAGKLKEVFISVSLMPRVIAGLVLTGVGVGSFYGWLTSPRPALPPQVPAAVPDLAIILLLAGLGWLGVALAGQQAFKRVMPLPVKLKAAGGLIALLTMGAIIIGCLALLYWPETRPLWLKLYLR